jgi:hypothetical protein
MSNKKAREKYVDIITSSIKKKNNNYYQNVVVFVNADKVDMVKGVKKAMEVEKHITSNDMKGEINKIEFHKISHHIVGCSYVIDFFDTKVAENLIDKFRIKNVDMNKLIDDLNNNGINVNKLLNELSKNNLDNITAYFTKNNIDLANVMVIIDRNGVNLNNIIENPFIYNMIKKSSYAWFLKDKKTSTASLDDNTKTLAKRLHVYAIYNISDESNIHITSIQWTLIK